MTTRRGFLTGLVSVLAAPLVVKAEILMPVKTIISPLKGKRICCGILDETGWYPKSQNSFQNYIKILNDLERKGIPIPFRAYANAGVLDWGTRNAIIS